jgi:O-antigen ligase
LKEQPSLKQLTATIRSGKLPETILLNILRLPQQAWFILGGFGLFALIIGLIVAPDWTVYSLTAVGIGIPLFLLVWHRPDLGLVGIIFLAAGLLPPDLAEIRLPIGGLELRDVAFLGMLGLVAFQGLVRKSLPIHWSPVGIPLLIFLLLASFSLFNALVFENVATNLAFNDMRILIYYGMFFLTTWSIKWHNHLTAVLIALFAVANLIAMTIFLQQFLGESSYVLSAMSGGRWQVYDQDVVVRVVPAAHALLYFMGIIALVLLIFTRHNLKLKLFYLFQSVFLNIALLLTFTRSQWLATVIALALIFVFLLPLYKDQLIKFSLKYGLPLLLLTVFAVWFGGSSLQRTLYDNPVVNGIIDRAATIFTPDETLDTNSLEWREFEFEESTRAIRENPWLGVSLGNAYRQVTTLQGEVLGWWTDGSLAAGEISRFTYYVHNSYLSIAVKMGIPGIGTFIWFAIAFIIYGWRLYRRLPMGVEKGLVLAIVTSFIGLMQWSIFHTHFIRSESTVTIGLMVGIVGSIHLLTKDDTAVLQQTPPQRLQLTQLTAIFNKGSGFYGLLFLLAGLIALLLVVEPLVRNRTAVSLLYDSPATENQLAAVDDSNNPAPSVLSSQKVNIIQPLDLQTFASEESIFVSWIWLTKLEPEQQFTILLLNEEQQFVLGTQSQEGSNNRYWLKTTIPAQIPGGEYQLLIQLQSTSETAVTASSPTRIIYILTKPNTPTPINTPTPTSTATPLPTATPVPLVQIVVSSVSFREGPGIRYGIIGYLYTDDLVRVIAKDNAEGNWYNVISQDGTYGWIASNVTIPLDEAAITAVSPAATLPPLPTPTKTPTLTITPTQTPTPINPPQQEDPSEPTSPQPQLTYTPTPPRSP